MEIRPADAAEIGELARLWHDGWQDAHARILPAELARYRTLESFGQVLTTALSETRVAGPVGRPHGFCITKGDELYQLYVSAAARGSGVAAALLADAEDRIGTHGTPVAWLACAIGNDRAARFYAKHGWTRVGNTILDLPTPDGPFRLEVWRYEKRLRAFSISSDGQLAMTASATSSRNDFDYLVGKWHITNRTLKEPLVGSDEWEDFDATQEFRQVLFGLGNVDVFHTELGGRPFEGLTVRLFDPQTRLWTIYWADSNAVKLDGGKVGSFDGDMGEFFGREVVGGKDVIVQFHWDKRDPKAPIYSRAFSADEGRTWEWNWYSHFSRP